MAISLVYGTSVSFNSYFGDDEAVQTELIVWTQNGSSHKVPDSNLSAEFSTLLFLRNSEIKQIEFSYGPENYS